LASGDKEKEEIVVDVTRQLKAEGTVLRSLNTASSNV
jgi:hypothetical protein